VRHDVVATENPDTRRAAENARPDQLFLPGVADAMKATGDTDKDGAKQSKPSEKPTAEDPDRRESAAPEPPSESDRTAAAKANPLRPSAERREAPEGEDASAGKESRDAANDREPPAKSGKARAKGAPELRISANMLSTQPKGGPAPEEERPPTAGKTRYRRRVKSLARPVEPAVVNPLSLAWPRANSRRGARRASRYGFVGLILALIWIALEVRGGTINQALNAFSSSTLAVAVAIGTLAVIVLTVIGYFYHSRLAALSGLAGVIALIVLYDQSESVTALEILGQVAVVYLLLHGVHGAIAYHIFGRRKRRRGSGYRYKRD
jgi:hypothetical protein